MYKKLALITVVALLSFGSLFAQEEPEAATSDYSSLEEVTTDSPTADIGLDAPVDDSMDDDTSSVDDVAPVGGVAPVGDVTPVGGATMTDSAPTTTTASKGKTYFDGVNTYANSMVMFKLDTSDNFMSDKIMYTIDDIGETEYASPFSIADEGRHNIKYWGVDKIGNIENPQVFSIFIDNTAPETVVTTDEPVWEVAGKYYISETNSVSITGRDTMSGLNNIQYALDGMSYTGYSTSFKFTTEGDVDFRIRSEDNVGNVTDEFRVYLPDVSGTPTSMVRSSLSFYVDKTAPTVAIAADRPFLERKGKNVAGVDYNYSITADDTESGVREILYRLDGKGAFRKYDGTFNITTNGDHFIEARAIDNVGNRSEIVIISIFVDVIPPASTITTVTEEE
ncbi:MAG: hypothetical protein PF637_03000 [Spirochaetes bacterium]|jgi:hypothetical protein|nr:hypothetical protein [Spirochaetota bacterium]